jgi:hypothetical protein
MPLERICEPKRPVEYTEPRAPALSLELVLGAVIAVCSSLLLHAGPHTVHNSAWSIAAVVLSLLLLGGFAIAALPFLLDDTIDQDGDPNDAEGTLQDC